MKFTDDDVKRWRKEIADARAQQPVSYFKINDSEMDALLARLEAAENLLSAYDTKEQEKAFEVWCKAKGE